MTNLVKKIYLLLLVFTTLFGTVKSQIGLEQMTKIKLGETLSETKQTIMSMFKEKPSIMKADFFGAYRIKYDDMPFNYYGDADYTFQYVKDTLVAIKIVFSFKASDTGKFRRLYNTLLNDLNGDRSKKLLKEYSTLNPKNIFSYINANCVTTTPKDDKNYKPIKTKFLGQNFWAVYENEIYTDKFLRLYIQLTENHSSRFENGTMIKYDGAKAEAILEITSERLQDLKGKEEETEISNYRSIIEPIEQVKMKLENGVFYLPVKLNNILTIDFILDLGASDVSISPDIFLVLYRAGTIKESDFIGSQNYQFADGSTAKSSVFNIKSIQIGNKEIKNVRASISNTLSAPLLLGQSAMKKFNSYRIDNYQNLLILE